MKSREWGQFLAKMEIEAVSAEELNAAAADVADDRRRRAGPVALPATLRRAVVTAALGDMRAEARPRRRRPDGVAGLMLLTVAASAVLVWPEGQHSSRTLAYADAVRLLGRPDQDPAHYGSALAVVYQNVRAGIAVLTAAVGSGEPVATAASAALNDLRAVRAGQRSWVVRRSCGELPRVLVAVLPPISGAVGIDAVAVIREAVAAGIAAIIDMRGGDQNAWVGQRAYVARITQALR